MRPRHFLLLPRIRRIALRRPHAVTRCASCCKRMSGLIYHLSAICMKVFQEQLLTYKLQSSVWFGPQANKTQHVIATLSICGYPTSNYPTSDHILVPKNNMPVLLHFHASPQWYIYVCSNFFTHTTFTRKHYT